MQFHLEGFRPGDPAISDAARRRAGGGATVAEEVDVLVVGSGPTGLTLAAQLAAIAGLRVRVLEQKPGPIELGQADGIACRTMEMFQAFGFAGRVEREAYWVNEVSFWKPDEAEPSCIVRDRIVQDVEDDLSEFPHVVLNQARVHDFLIERMRAGESPVEPEYSKRLLQLGIDESQRDASHSHPVTATFECLAGERAGSVETVRARYVVGCDGARSAVRRCLGYSLDGDSANQAWGVMDVLAATDFPDVRRKAAIHSAEQGSLLIIPREGGYLVRMYVELDKLAEDQRVASLDVTPEYLVAAARRILHPYSLEVREVAWWSVYEIGHRLCERFDDRPSSVSPASRPRVFIAGDACHTHSPKAGQGMNVSMQDAFNLGWKLADVIRGRADATLLATYEEERRAIARELIDFDHRFARMFSARPKSAVAAGEGEVDPREFQAYFVRQGRFTAGVATHYQPSLITGDGTHQSRAAGFVVGMRFHSAPAIRAADAKPVHLGHVVRADGRWRLFAFADPAAPTSPSSALAALCRFLEASTDSPLRRHTPQGLDVDAVIELVAILQQGPHELSIPAMPPLLRPSKGRYGLVDYEKVYCADRRPGHDVYELRGVDRARGALVIVRPDQYVAYVLPLDAHAELAAFFRGFMTVAGER